MRSVSLLPSHFLVLSIFLSLFKHIWKVALSPWLNMHSNHSAMQKHNEGLSGGKTNGSPGDYSALGLHDCLVHCQEIQSRTGSRYLESQPFCPGVDHGTGESQRMDRTLKSFFGWFVLFFYFIFLRIKDFKLSILLTFKM